LSKDKRMHLLRRVRRRHIIIISGVLGVLVLFTIIALIIDSRAFKKQENIFNNHQLLQTLLVCKGIDDHIKNLMLEPKQLANHAFPEYLKGNRPPRSIQNLFLSKNNDYPEYCVQIYYDKTKRPNFSFFSESANKEIITKIIESWLTEFDTALASSKESTPIIPPYVINSSMRCMGVLFPVHVNGHHAGTLVTVINLDPLLQNYVAPMKSGKFGAAYAIDNTGRILYDHEPEIIGRNIFDGMHNDYPDVQRFDKRLMTELSGQDEYHFTVKRGGKVVRKLAAWNTITTGTQSIIVALSAPDSEIEEGMSDLRNQRTLLTIILVCICVGFAIAVSYTRHKYLIRNAEKLQKLVDQKTKDLIESEQKIRTIFNESPISLWEIDFSEIKKYLKSLNFPESDTLQKYIIEHPEIALKSVELVRINNVNKATLDLLECSNQNELIDLFPKLFSKEALDLVSLGLIAILQGETTLEGEASFFKCDGSQVYFNLKAAFLPGHEEDWSRILLTNTDITNRKQNEEKIQISLKEKDTLLRELYHRTKNNMQVICSMLSLQSTTSANDELKSAFKQMENKIHSMALVHQKLYQSQNLSSISLKEYIEDLTLHVIRSYEVYAPRVKSQLDLEEVFVLLDIAIPIGLILSELLSNSMKYAFAGRTDGIIGVYLRRISEDTIILKTYDNGNGPYTNFDIRQNSKMGLKSVLALAELQLQGKFDFSSENGFSCTMTFKDTMYNARV
jgi:two-component sensor histidine kinase